MLVIKETKTEAIGTCMVPHRGASEYFIKVIVDFMSGCGCSRAFQKSDGEPATVALQHAVKKIRQSDAILGKSPKETVNQTEQQRML